MKQLSGIDVSFLNMETSNSFGHVASMTVFDVEHAPPGGAGVEATKRVILERIEQLAPFRRRLIEVPMGLDLPYWIEDPDFDIDFHVRAHAVAAPGTPELLAEAVSRIHARPMDRSRPLWELYVIEGVDGGTKIAQLTKVHHATIDGASGALMLAAILDTTPEGTGRVEPPHWTPDAVPTDQQLLWLTARQFVRNPERFIRLTVRTLREVGSATRNAGIKTMAETLAQPLPGPVGQAIRTRLRGGAEVDDPPALPSTPAPRTPWNASITPHRRFAYTTIPLDDAKTIRRAYGCTFNDVVMALCSSTLRRYLIGKEALPKEPLIAAVPVSVRTGDETDMYQNRVSMVLADLATNEPDPVKRLRRVQQSMTKAKTQFAAIPAESLQDYSQFAPPAIAARAMRMYSRLRIADRASPPFNLIISNVPGPSTPLYSAGAQLLHFYPISAVTDGQGLNMTVQSYNGNLDFGFVSCRELIPDLWRLTELLQESMAEYLGLARAELGADASTSAAPVPAPATSAAKRTAAKRAGAKRTAATRKSTARKAATPRTVVEEAQTDPAAAADAGAQPTTAAAAVPAAATPVDEARVPEPVETDAAAGAAAAEAAAEQPPVAERAPARKARARRGRATKAPARKAARTARASTAPAKKTARSARDSTAPTKKTTRSARPSTTPAKKTTRSARDSTTPAKKTARSARDSTAPAKKTARSARANKAPAKKAAPTQATAAKTATRKAPAKRTAARTSPAERAAAS